MSVGQSDTSVQDLASALRLAGDAAARAGDVFCVALVTGFTPIHVSAFLAASLGQRLQTRRIEVQTVGHWGQIRQNLLLAEQGSFHAVAVCIEWDDLDPRLGSRNCAAPGPADEGDIIHVVRQRAGEIGGLLKRLAEVRPVVVSLPCLPLLPFSGPPRWSANRLQLQLSSIIFDVAAELSDSPLLRLLNPEFLNEKSPVAHRRDLKAEFRWGSPYGGRHMAVLCEGIARLLAPEPPLKGLITDLDNTLWKGIVGEVGVDGVSWDLQGGAQIHAVYQRMLASLASAGTLLAIASKNDPAVVAKALERQDLILPTSVVFPVAVGWGPKSISIKQILSQWNVAPDSVAFVDDSALELAEVGSAFPAIRCLQFPASPEQVMDSLLLPLRDMFGKFTTDETDLLRTASIRETAIRNEAAVDVDPDEFLRSLKPEIIVEWNKPDRRSFELINKTNQFNLNGRRIDEASWVNRAKDPTETTLTAAYSDKFGPLGKVAVMAGSVSDGIARIELWVLSCRAFSRRIEHQMLASVFQRFNVDAVEFKFVATERNGPLQEFLQSLGMDLSEKPLRVDRGVFETCCPELPFTVLEQ